MNPTHERIPRKAECVQWSGNNTQTVIELLARHGMLGHLYREKFISIRWHGAIMHTLHHGEWLAVGEDKVLRFYVYAKFKSKYRPIVENDELERLRAFARDVISRGMDDPNILVLGVLHELLIPGANNGCRLAESLKAPT